MRLAVVACAALLFAGGCSHEFDYMRPSRVASEMPPPPNAPGVSHAPYQGKPQYLAAARPLQATTSAAAAAKAPECATRSQACEDRLRATLASLDGQILALSAPATELQVSTLRLQAQQLAPLLAAYPDVQAEGDELAATVEKLPAMSAVDVGSARRRLTELTDLIRVQLAAGE
jgi:hypothetical protein